MSIKGLGTRRRALRSVLAIVFAFVVVVLVKITARAQNAGLSGLAEVSGTVTGPKPFKAAKVYWRNTDKRILYMVYTSDGHYHAMDMFPGNYEFTVKAEGEDSQTEKIVLKPGNNPAEDATLEEASVNNGGAEVVSFNTMYPAGPARDLAEKTCMGCHGTSFLPQHQWNAQQWNAALDMMTGMRNINFSASERATMIDWLTKNFGPNSKPRTLKFDVPMPVDETKISKAEYIEYYLQPHPAGQDKEGPFGGRVDGQDPHFDMSGYVWFTDRGKPARICRLDPRTGQIKTWDTPEGSVHGLTVDGNGIVWVPNTDSPEDKYLEAFDPKTQTFHHYEYDPGHTWKGWDTRPISGHTPVLDSKQNVWVTMIIGDRLVKWDRRTKELTSYETASHPSSPYGIDIDNHDNIWIAESRGPARIAKFDPKTLKWTEYNALTQPARIRRLSVDSKDNVWYGLFSAGKIGKLDPSTGKITEIPIPQQFSQPYDIWPDTHDNIWVSDAGEGGALIKYDQNAGTFTYFPSPQVSDQPKIEITRDGAIWYCPRSGKEGGVGVLYPDITKVTTLMAFYPKKGATITKSMLPATN